jgi:hypothetical protein
MLLAALIPKKPNVHEFGSTEYFPYAAHVQRCSGLHIPTCTWFACRCEFPSCCAYENSIEKSPFFICTSVALSVMLTCQVSLNARPHNQNNVFVFIIYAYFISVRRK